MGSNNSFSKIIADIFPSSGITQTSKLPQTATISVCIDSIDMMSQPAFRYDGRLG